MKILIITTIFIITALSMNAQIDLSRKNEIRLNYYTRQYIAPDFPARVGNIRYFSAQGISYNRQLVADFRNREGRTLWMKSGFNFAHNGNTIYVSDASFDIHQPSDYRIRYYEGYMGLEVQNQYKYVCLFPSLGLYGGKYFFNSDLNMIDRQLDDFQYDDLIVGSKLQLLLAVNITKNLYLTVGTSFVVNYNFGNYSHEIEGVDGLKVKGWNSGVNGIDGLGISWRFWGWVIMEFIIGSY